MENSSEIQTGEQPQRIVVIGGGIAGTEAALTLAIGLPKAHVTLLGAGSSIAILPSVIYVPFGVEPNLIKLDSSSLLAHGVHHKVATVQWVDIEGKLVRTDAGDVPFDVLVAAPGAELRSRSDRSLRNLSDSIALHDKLEDIVERARKGERVSIALCAEADNAWTAPACELAILIGTWMRSLRLDNKVETLLATVESEPFDWFGEEGNQLVLQALKRARVKTATGLPLGFSDEFDSDLVIEFGALGARVIDGLPGLGASGWYEPSKDFEVAKDVFVIGDATNLPYRAGFATAWQSRRVLKALGGDIERLGSTIDGIPVGSAEYQMDLGDGLLRARIDNADALGRPFLGHDAEVWTTAGARPDKLTGLVLHDRIIRWKTVNDAPLKFRDRLRERTAG